MVSFTCETRNADGARIQRTLDASSQREAMTLLEKDGLFPVEIREASGDVAAAEPTKRSPITGALRVDRRIKRKLLLTFSLQLASSVNAGVPILVALEGIGRQTSDLAFQSVLSQMASDLEGGLSLSEAMKNHPKAFPEAYSSTVAAGEAMGNLSEVLENLAQYLESDIEVRADVRSALLYPAMVIGTLCLAISVLIVFVVPRFAKFYSGFGADLPLPTRILIAVSTTATEYFPALVLGSAALVWSFARFYRTRAGRRAIDRFLLRVPVIRTVIVTANTLHVTQMIGLFVRAGVPILQGLRTIARTTTSTKFSESMLAVAEGVAGGATLADSMEASDCLPPTARQMIASGESTGTLDSACLTVSGYFKKELRYLTKNLATLIEPVLTLVLAVIVLFVALAVFLPMWDLVKVIKR